MPPNRIVVSMTTSPRRIQLFHPVVDSILAQTIQPSAIYLNLPDKFRNRETYTIPNWLNDVASIRINQTVAEDWGPAMKILPTLAMEREPETVIITIDDDVIYPQSALATFAEASARQSDTAFCSMGFRFASDSGHIQPVREHLQRCDALQGFSGCCYRRVHFDEAELRSEIAALPEQFQINDDIILSNHVAAIGVKRATVKLPGKLEFTDWSDSDPDALKSVGPGTHSRYLKMREHLMANQRWHLT